MSSDENISNILNQIKIQKFYSAKEMGNIGIDEKFFSSEDINKKAICNNMGEIYGGSIIFSIKKKYYLPFTATEIQLLYFDRPSLKKMFSPKIDEILNEDNWFFEKINLGSCSADRVPIDKIMNLNKLYINWIMETTESIKSANLLTSSKKDNEKTVSENALNNATRNIAPLEVSLNQPFSDETDSTLENIISCPKSDFSKEIENKNLENLFNKIINELPNLEKKVIKMKYSEEKNYKEIGEELGINKDRVRTLEKKATLKLKKTFTKLKITSSEIFD